MSEEAKKGIRTYYNGMHASTPLKEAYELARKYAQSTNADPEKIPQLIVELTHLFETGEILKKDDQ